MPDIADGPFANHLRGLLQGGHVAVAEVDHVHHARFGGGTGHFLRLRRICGQWLFAQHMLACGQEGQGGGVMRGVGGDVGHRIELAPGQRFIHRGEAVRDAMCLLKGGKPIGAGVDAGDKSDTGDRGEAFGMVLRHAAGAKDQKPDRLHHRYPSSPSWCRRGPRSVIGSSAFVTGVFGASVGLAIRASGLCAQRTALAMTFCTTGW